jgi:formate-dependent nitrite reductase cytochrome c552 subunit
VNGRVGESAVAQKTAARKAAAEARAMEEKLARIEEEHRQAKLRALADWQASNLTQKVSTDCTVIFSALE